jgi:hypothetical protein
MFRVPITTLVVVVVEAMVHLVMQLLVLLDLAAADLAEAKLLEIMQK